MEGFKKYTLRYLYMYASTAKINGCVELYKISSDGMIVSIMRGGFCFEVSTSHAVEQRFVSEINSSRSSKMPRLSRNAEMRADFTRAL